MASKKMEIKNVAGATFEEAFSSSGAEMFCKSCGKGPPAVVLRVCQQCRTASYCSRACQKFDWKVHKGFCKPKEPPRADGKKSVDEVFSAWANKLHFDDTYFECARQLLFKQKKDPKMYFLLLHAKYLPDAAATEPKLQYFKKEVINKTELDQILTDGGAQYKRSMEQAMKRDTMQAIVTSNLNFFVFLSCEYEGGMLLSMASQNFKVDMRNDDMEAMYNSMPDKNIEELLKEGTEKVSV